MDEEQRQELKGWYDEIVEDNVVQRKHYSITWKPIFRYEMELILEAAGFKNIIMEGDHHGNAYTSASRRMFVQAIRI